MRFRAVNAGHCHYSLSFSNSSHIQMCVSVDRGDIPTLLTGSNSRSPIPLECGVKEKEVRVTSRPRCLSVCQLLLLWLQHQAATAAAAAAAAALALSYAVASASLLPTRPPFIIVVVVLFSSSPVHLTALMMAAAPRAGASVERGRCGGLQQQQRQ